MRKVGLITIHGINNFGSLLQAYATQQAVIQMGYECEVINYKYPNEYHLQRMKVSSPYAAEKMSFIRKVQAFFYRRWVSPKNLKFKTERYVEERNRLLRLTQEYSTKESLMENPPVGFDIYLTGSDQVWNPRYLYEDITYLLPFAKTEKKIAFSASFGQIEIDEIHENLMRPLLSEYHHISIRENSGIEIVEKICGKKAICTCDPTLLLNDKDWGAVFDDEPIIKGNYILCYILTYTANPYPYAYKFVKHIQKLLKFKVIYIDETGRFWCDFRVKSIRRYGPREIINLFRNASFIISSSFHGAAFSLNFKKDFYSIFPHGVKDERQENLLTKVGALDRFIHVGDPFPAESELRIRNWDMIGEKLQKYVEESEYYLKQALEL